MSRLPVAVLAGGPSPERDISFETAAAVLAHLPPDRFEGIRVEVLPDGLWRVGEGKAESPAAAALRLRQLGVQVVFPGLHGRYGEDGTVQGFLEVLGFAYVGSGVAASAVAMDKAIARLVAGRAGLSLPEAAEIVGGEAESKAELEALGLPVFVKDPTGGSSIDLFVARTAKERDAAVTRLLARPGGRVLVEARVAGIEMTGPVLGNGSSGGPVRALPPILIRPLVSDWFDTQTKYDPEAAEEAVPAPVDEEIVERVRSASVLAHRALRCDGLTRSDFIVPEDGIPRFLEINTLPGLTPASLCPKAAAAAGMKFSDLVAELVDLALQKRGIDWK